MKVAVGEFPREICRKSFEAHELWPVRGAAAPLPWQGMLRSPFVSVPDFRCLHTKYVLLMSVLPVWQETEGLSPSLAEE